VAELHPLPSSCLGSPRTKVPKARLVSFSRFLSSILHIVNLMLDWALPLNRRKADKPFLILSFKEERILTSSCISFTSTLHHECRQAPFSYSQDSRSSEISLKTSAMSILRRKNPDCGRAQILRTCEVFASKHRSGVPGRYYLERSHTRSGN